MKAKLFLGLSVCCFLVSLGLLLGSLGPKVTFAQDPVKHHGMQARSFCIECETGGDLYEVFSLEGINKRFIVTDITTFGWLYPESFIVLSVDEGYTIKAVVNLSNSDNSNSLSLRTGICFEPGEKALVSSDEPQYVTIFGYYVE